MSSAMDTLTHWAAGHVLPDEQTVQKAMRYLAAAVGWAICGAVLTGGLLCLGLYGLFVGMQYYGLAPVPAAFMVALLAALGALVCLLMTRDRINRLAKLEYTTRRSDPMPDLVNSAASLVNAFVDGFISHPPHQPHSSQQSQSSQFTDNAGYASGSELSPHEINADDVSVGTPNGSAKH